MNLSAAYLAIVAFSLFPKVVRATDWGLQTLLDELETPRSLFASVDPFESSFSSMMQRHQQMMEQAFGSVMAWTPVQQQYSIELNNSPQLFELKVHLPSGLSPADLKVDLDERTRQLTIEGHHEYTNEETGHRFTSSFSRSFDLDPFVEVDQLKAITTEEGVLVVSAPKNVERMKHAVRAIPVTKALEIEAPPAAEELDNPEEEEEESVEEEASSGQEQEDSFDPFHIKERVQKTLLRNNENATFNKKNPNKRLEDTYSGFKTSELRRRRR